MSAGSKCTQYDFRCKAHDWTKVRASAALCVCVCVCVCVRACMCACVRVWLWKFVFCCIAMWVLSLVWIPISCTKCNRYLECFVWIVSTVLFFAYFSVCGFSDPEVTATASKILALGVLKIQFEICARNLFSFCSCGHWSICRYSDQSVKEFSQLWPFSVVEHLGNCCMKVEANGQEKVSALPVLMRSDAADQLASASCIYSSSFD